MRLVIIIPARYKSSRFPGKPLAKILEKSLIERVWLNCINVIPKSDVYVATDSKKIANHCIKKDINYILTSKSCITGTDRVYEASKKIKADIIINVQGDEPLILEKDLKKFLKISKKNTNTIHNAMCAITLEKDFRNNAIPKVVFDKKNNLLYMSRSPIPVSKKNEFIKGWKQVCMYSFPKTLLKKFAKEKQKTEFEKIEDIEILRFLELGFKVKMVQVSQASIAVDYPGDIKKVEKAIIRESKKV